MVEIADNSLKSLPDLLFKLKTVERLDLSGNQLLRVPVSSFKGDAAASLMELDLSSNLIMSLHSVDIFHRFPVFVVAHFLLPGTSGSLCHFFFFPESLLARSFK